MMDERDLAAVLGGRRVLVTGYSGFKGGWLSLWLRRLGAHVVGIALPAEERSFSAAIGLDRLVDSRAGDIRTAAAFEDALRGEDFDLVIHMAAQALVRASFADPVDTYQTNVVGTAVVLEAARRMPSLRGVVVVTSDKCYENREWHWGYRENDPMGGRDPYSSSKGCAELVAAAYRDSFFRDPAGPQLATVRAGNVIGGGDWGLDRIVPDLVRAAETGRPARIRNPASVRPWQHVLEPLRGYLMVAAGLLTDGPRHAGAWNFGPDGSGTADVGTLADLVCDIWGAGGPSYVIDRPAVAPPESVLLRLDSTKARVDLGWTPLLDLEATVATTVDWYRRHKDGERMLAVSERQIDDYTALWQAAGAAGRTHGKMRRRVA